MNTSTSEQISRQKAPVARSWSGSEVCLLSAECCHK